MKKLLCTLVILTAVITPGLVALELELAGGLGNLAFDHDRTSALSESGVEGTFSPNYFPLALVRLSGEYRGFSCNAGFERDPLERNRLFANIRADLDYFFIEAGPFIGLFNSRALPLNPGISAALGLMVPGIFFVQAAGSSTLGTVMDLTGRYFQNSGSISAGFWVPYVICSLNMSVKDFTIREEANLLITDQLTRYFFKADVYTKNVPYTIQVDIGYQSLQRSYQSERVDGTALVKDTITDEFKSLFAGLEGTYTLNPALKLLLGAEMPVYSWGVRPMKDPSRGTFFFQAKAGVIVSF